MVFYLNNMQNINNWNLVDISAHFIIGAYLFDKDRSILLKLPKSQIMWEKRIAIVSTWYFIRQNDLEYTFKISEMLLDDKHNLIHKAAGWMLREAGKRNLPSLLEFLDKHHKNMPRTMLRYSIEKLSEAQKKIYMQK